MLTPVLSRTWGDPRSFSIDAYTAARGYEALPKAARDYLRVFLSGAVDQEPDKQGRVLVPQMLRDYANLGSDIVVIGVGTRAEIWNRQAWEDYLADKEQGYSDIADDVLPAMEF